MRAQRRLLALLTLGIAVGIASPSARAEETPVQDARRGAADAYDKGTARYALRDYASAADWFELADRLAPASSSLQSAVRSHRQAGAPSHLARAATLALDLRARYPSDAASLRLATEVIAEASRSMSRLRVTCDACRLEIDGSAAPSELFLTPGAHRVVARFAGGAQAARDLDLGAGHAESVQLAPPAAAAAAPVRRELAPPPSPAPAPRVETGVSPLFAVTGMALSGALAATTAVSWFGDAVPKADTLLRDARATGNRDVAQEATVAAAETRTTVLLTATAVTAAATIVLSVFFTRWRSATVAPGPSGASLGTMF